MSPKMSLFMALVTKNVTENVTGHGISDKKCHQNVTKKVDNAVFQLLTFNILFKIRFRSCFTHEYRLPKANITPLGISLAPLAQTSIYLLSPHPPSPRRRSPFSTKLGRAERAKVDFSFQLSIFNLLAPLCALKNSPRGEMKQKPARKTDMRCVLIIL